VLKGQAWVNFKVWRKPEWLSRNVFLLNYYQFILFYHSLGYHSQSFLFPTQVCAPYLLLSLNCPYIIVIVWMVVMKEGCEERPARRQCGESWCKTAENTERHALTNVLVLSTFVTIPLACSLWFTYIAQWEIKTKRFNRHRFSKSRNIKKNYFNFLGVFYSRSRFKLASFKDKKIKIFI